MSGHESVKDHGKRPHSFEPERKRPESIACTSANSSRHRKCKYRSSQTQPRSLSLLNHLDLRRCPHNLLCADSRLPIAIQPVLTKLKIPGSTNRFFKPSLKSRLAQSRSLSKTASSSNSNAAKNSVQLESPWIGSQPIISRLGVLKGLTDKMPVPRWNYSSPEGPYIPGTGMSFRRR